MIYYVYALGFIIAALLIARSAVDPKTGKILEISNEGLGPWSGIVMGAFLWPLIAGGWCVYILFKGIANAIRFIVETPEL